MERVQSPDAPAKLVYQQLHNDWGLLSDLFAREDQRGCPKLALYDSRKSSLRLRNPLAYLEFQPSNQPEYLTQWVQRTTDAFMSDYYALNEHLIVINRDNHASLNHVLTHETTHSVVRVTDRDKINISPVNLGRLETILLKLQMRLKLREIRININEFFPPLGESYLLGNKRKEYSQSIHDIFYKFLMADHTYPDFRIFMATHSSLTHIPLLAGEIMINLYRGDTKALLMEHPMITKTTAEQLWETYCIPLLSTGKL